MLPCFNSKFSFSFDITQHSSTFANNIVYVSVEEKSAVKDNSEILKKK